MEKLLEPIKKFVSPEKNRGENTSVMNFRKNHLKVSQMKFSIDKSKFMDWQCVKIYCDNDVG